MHTIKHIESFIDTNQSIHVHWNKVYERVGWKKVQVRV